MFLFKLTQSENSGYDTYSAMVVSATTSEGAQQMLPPYTNWDDQYSSWASHPSHVEVELLGTSDDVEPRIVLTSFHAG